MVVAEAHSFTGETRVAMADGSSKRIDEIKAGDQVKNAVPGKPGATETHKVDKVDKVIVTRTDRDFVDVTVTPTAKTGGLGSRVLKKAATAAATVATAAAVLTPATATASPASPSTITTTYHHPFYDQTQSSFVEAKDLHEGDLLETEDGNVEVKAVRLYHADAVTYDLTVDGLHTYYVLAGTASILVHNCELSDHSQEIRNVIHDGSKSGGRPYKNQTVAIIRADKGDGTSVNVVAASGDGLTDAQLGSLKPGETAAANDPSLHAETNAMQHIANNGWSLAEGGVSRNVCPFCENSIRSEGGALTGPTAWKGRVNYALNGKIDSSSVGGIVRSHLEEGNSD